MTLVEKTSYTVTSNNAPPENTPAWQANRSYAVDDKVLFLNKICICAKPNNGKSAPNMTVDEWVEAGSPNPTRFQDEYVNTQTKSDTRLEIVISVPEASVNSFGLFNVDGAKILIYDKNDTLIFERALATRNDSASWWQYFFGAVFNFRNDVWHLGDVDYSGRIKIVIEPNEKGANLGHLVVGRKIFLGDTLYEPSVSMIDYSKEFTDDWGFTRLRKGATAKYCAVKVIVPSPQVDFVEKTLARTAGELNLFIADEREDGFECLAVFGYFKDKEVVISNAQTSELSINLKGVI